MPRQLGRCRRAARASGGNSISNVTRRKYRSWRNEPLGHALAKLLVGGRDDAEIALHRPVAAHRQHLAVLQGPQQLHLERQGDVGHLVEEDRAAVGLLQQSLPGLVGAGEGPAGVAEQLALGQGRAERGHVHGHERPLRRRL